MSTKDVKDNVGIDNSSRGIGDSLKPPPGWSPSANCAGCGKYHGGTQTQINCLSAEIVRLRTLILAEREKAAQHVCPDLTVFGKAHDAIPRYAGGQIEERFKARRKKG